jgi:4-hydroxy-2-oxoheptanedioate aldolase
MNASIPSVEAMRGSGYDSILFDMQHSALTYDTVYHAMLAMGDSPITTMVRLPGFNAGVAMKLLDAGVEGIMCPQVDTPEQAATFVDACKYPPLGNRSFGPFRAARGTPMAEYIQGANDQVVTLAQIESKAAMDNLEAIVATPGIDAVFVGPADLSISHGGPPGIDYEDDVVRERHLRIISTAHAAGVKVGMLAPTPAHLERALEWGADLLGVANEVGLVTSGAAEILTRTQTAIEQAGPVS